ncbi:NAD(P)-dependent alcohol dehydrogenase [Sphingobacterium thalpophilum]|uniref:NAD(P)-dependent alcohol dehydrogenase n=1 Tax=Sphingobacterium thalpophilum TaxID=259 RepID=A0A4U9VN50_9SPHI|nr:MULTISPECIES: NAD(P)-dependent alcohol dehydrogenase [Sphingobacterium]MCW8311251.1 NAD(P)-dependent alcohol dehydrogenase [Sphingobacterium sp. InxBP1]VTR47733.1 NADP-dependent alcohol dehydrogenase C 2 [Sphingobacterium thalpophilum]
MIKSKGYAAKDQHSPLEYWEFERRELGPNDVLIDILYSGICHSDIHQVRDEWGGTQYPIVPGHEIVGRIQAVGSEVTKFKQGDLAGVGCMVASCGECDNCKSDQQQFCQQKKTVWTYNSVDVMHDHSCTYGGYSNNIVADANFVLHVPETLDITKVAPLLCAGITTYSPLKRWNVRKGHKVGVLGLGGLGHMAVKIAVAMGAEVTMISHSPRKKADAALLGAQKFLNAREASAITASASYFDFIIDTVSAPHDYNVYLSLLKTQGVYICVGIPAAPMEINGRSIMGGNKILTASSIGGVQETQDMLNFCAAHNILPETELIDIDYVNEAYQRVLDSDVKYRFVIDMASIDKQGK